MELFEYQHVGVEFLQERPLGLLLDDCGVGKTPTGICAMEARRPALLKVPACLRFKWASELEKWRPGVWKVHHVEHIGAFRWPKPGEAVVISPELVPSTKGEIARARAAVRDSAANTEGVLDFARKVDPAAAARKLERLVKQRGVVDDPPEDLHVLGDEVHEDSNNKSAQTQRVRSLYRAVRKANGVVHGLTATPVLNDPMELLGLLTTYGLLQDSFGGWFDFLRAWGGSKGPFGTVWGEPNDAAIAGAMRGVGLRRLLRDVRPDMPPLLAPQFEHVDLDEAVRDLSMRAEQDLAKRGVDVWAYLKDDEERPRGKGRETARIAFEWISRIGAALSTCKLPVAERVVERFARAGEPVLVGGPFIEPLEVLGRRPGWALITGATSAAKRYAICQAFARGELKGIAASIRAGGVGIDLQRAVSIAPVVLLDPDYVPAWTRQFIARRWRTGQTCPVLPIFLRAEHPLETRKMEIVRAKRRLYQAIDAMAVRPAGVAA
jgi:hypothetical protein